MFCPQWAVCPCLGLYTCEKKRHIKKTVQKIRLQEIFFKLATNGQSDKEFLLTSAFVPKGLSAPALGLYTRIKALKYIPGPGVRWAITGPLVLWLCMTFRPEKCRFHSLDFKNQKMFIYVQKKRDKLNCLKRNKKGWCLTENWPDPSYWIVDSNCFNVFSREKSPTWRTDGVSLTHSWFLISGSP